MIRITHFLYPDIDAAKLQIKSCNQKAFSLKFSILQFHKASDGILLGGVGKKEYFCGVFWKRKDTSVRCKKAYY